METGLDNEGIERNDIIVDEDIYDELMAERKDKLRLVRTGGIISVVTTSLII